MNEINEQELATLLDEHAELHENMNNSEKENDNIGKTEIKKEMMNIAQEERMTSEEILREIDEQESLDMENEIAQKEVHIFKYVMYTIEIYKDVELTLDRLKNLMAHEYAEMTEESLMHYLKDYESAGYIRMNETEAGVTVSRTFLGECALALVK
ncbi:hypothetical protein [Macrococcoides caseolyticum]|uniref:Uncharacterized protein n=2 Tax=Macrococcoides caseolyticum TaxID=69966 RepID=A0A855GT77_9STAP|nr:hypothetical protein [Macrococcus caseolyticus]ARQ03438.1 hypothetical protein CA207_01600 [Macrococcus caseolyticus]MDJ1109341.1 hypothetical protein [Macrococcus caseolyticus]PKE11947.1 hypothetical protein CW685_05830 [Macrococcus caseolyticus]PKE19814.1 hypothetical protein CW679_03465 [Macrococcus caseolyticus]PKE27008.1 hypothetical protein CW686_02210 [Macrococcus caseolyticus]